MTPRLLNMLIAVGDYDTLTRVKIQEVCGEKNARVVRDMLATLRQRGLIAKTGQGIASSLGATAPVYYLTTKGKEYLMAEVDPKYRRCCTTCPVWTTLEHTVGVEKLHIHLDGAIALQNVAALDRWINERQVVNYDEEDAKKLIKLFTELREKPKLVCKPDAGFLLRVGPHRKAYYLELDRGTSSIHQISNSKTPGYAGMLKQQAHKRHFDTTMDTFSVLSVSLSPGRRDLLRAAFKGKEEVDLWKFCCWDDFAAPERLLFAPVWFPSQGDPSPLIKNAVAANTREIGGSGMRSAQGPPRHPLADHKEDRLQTT